MLIIPRVRFGLEMKFKSLSRTPHEKLSASRLSCPFRFFFFFQCFFFLPPHPPPEGDTSQSGGGGGGGGGGLNCIAWKRFFVWFFPRQCGEASHAGSLGLMDSLYWVTGDILDPDGCLISATSRHVTIPPPRRSDVQQSEVLDTSSHKAYDVSHHHHLCLPTKKKKSQRSLASKVVTKNGSLYYHSSKTSSKGWVLLRLDLEVMSQVAKTCINV